jgi:hypothetical protein
MAVLFSLCMFAGCGDSSSDEKGMTKMPADASAEGGTGDDAGSETVLACDGDTPHGCYVAEPGSHPMCPAHTPEQSAFYPPMAEWHGCNGIMPTAPFGGDPKASCSYKGPAGEIAKCLCDTGLHWLCTYP